MMTLILISMIFLAAGFTQGFSGFGSALLAMPLLTLFLDAKTAVPLSVLNSVLITSYLSLKLRSHMERAKIIPLVLGSLPGTYIGVKFLIYAESDIIKLLLGVLIVSYCLYYLFI
ncbi:MAG: sulfite exporter TauE/SafE family protein, partial [Nitrospirota bacterium]